MQKNRLFNPSMVGRIWEAPHIRHIRDFLWRSDCGASRVYAKADAETRRKALAAAYEGILPTGESPDWRENETLTEELAKLTKPRQKGERFGCR
ncbi:MAG: hypothetical protein LBT62_02665 [Deltaproteobacteria bacterium]|jgi:hypothetical protein|nr:hypothetical protein [Deltaproteobacteria bacterium]